MNCIICGNYVSYGCFCNYCEPKYSIIKCVPEGKRDWSFDRFKVTKPNQLAYQKAKRFVRESRYKEGNYNLFVSGVCGNGKTHLITASYMQALKEHIRSSFISFPVMSKLKRTEFETKEEAQIRILDYWNRDKLIFLDAIFDENVNDMSIDMLYCLLDNVISNGKQRIFMTSNFDLEHIGQTSDRISSRILRLCGMDNIIINAEEDWALKENK